MQALLRCKQPENAGLIELFQSKLDEAKNALIMADDTVMIHRLQGRAEVLQDFLEAVERSPEIVERVK